MSVCQDQILWSLNILLVCPVVFSHFLCPKSNLSHYIISFKNEKWLCRRPRLPAGVLPCCPLKSRLGQSVTATVNCSCRHSLKFYFLHITCQHNTQKINHIIALLPLKMTSSFLLSLSKMRQSSYAVHKIFHSILNFTFNLCYRGIYIFTCFSSVALT